MARGRWCLVAGLWQRTPVATPAEPCADLTDTAPMSRGGVLVSFHQMSGQELQLLVGPNTLFQDVSNELVALIAPSDRSMHARIIAGGGVVSSTAELLDCHRNGIPIQAALDRSPERMALPEVVEELSMEDAEFKGHRFALSKLPRGSTPRDAAVYLRSNNALLTAAQAADLFDLLVTKLVCIEGAHHGLRGQLVLALHTFCLEPYAIWEPNDGNAECVWANMTYNDKHLGYDYRYKIRGKLCNFPNSTSASSESKDVANLRAVLCARRQGLDDELSQLSLLKSYNMSILPKCD